MDDKVKNVFDNIDNRIYIEFNNVLKNESMSYTQACEIFKEGYTKQKLSQKLRNGTMQYNEAVELFDKLGYDVVVVKR